MSSETESSPFAALYRGNLIPLHAVLVGLTWIVHDYFVTLEDEIRYIWPQNRNIGKIMFLWVRYYSIALLLFDTVQIHVFSIPGITSDNLCVAMDSIIRVVGAISLWSVEIIMQLRVYALFKCSKKVAVINAVLFAGSIAGFSWILIHNAVRRRAVIAYAIHLPLPGCPVIHTGIEWAQWVPATAYEGVLFGFALFKTLESTAGRIQKGRRVSLYSLLLRDNILYFFAISCILVFNNLMVVGVTKIPWFSYGPFHAAVGVLTTRMLLNLQKAASPDIIASTFERSGSGNTEKSSRQTDLPWRAASGPTRRSGSIDSYSTEHSSPNTFPMRGIIDLEAPVTTA
ncbi:uncharacterized protein BT62DRAFT_972533 [Guyanagaster necrorhizus]|uniref:DUF6533 domain-containing protein n=1 Tax=Guyanagaster necrorhizus TaxID=856835 RepID=A0A9P7VM42_9AGAR|nr:uncharacterized protein BT62DRAFT_972533 [Guyanagaster necrorhizus MCA 3950]KAG7443214.1 hypothetical protein BT62DRAFT_972533 [Guyanagaster necrorhizus MCA 3950]